MFIGFLIVYVCTIYKNLVTIDKQYDIKYSQLVINQFLNRHSTQRGLKRMFILNNRFLFPLNANFRVLLYILQPRKVSLRKYYLKKYQTYLLYKFLLHFDEVQKNPTHYVHHSKYYVIKNSYTEYDSRTTSPI